MNDAERNHKDVIPVNNNKIHYHRMLANTEHQDYADLC